MGTNWLALDNRFPSFTGKETPAQQIKMIQNYLQLMKEQLRYMLRNLSTSNFSANGLQELTNETTGALLEEIKTLTQQLSGVSGTVSRLGTRMTGAETEITYVQDDLQDLREQLQAMQEELPDGAQLDALADRMELAEDALGQLAADMLGIEEDLAMLLSLVQVNEDGSFTIGGERATLHLVGEIYINGVKFEGGTV